MKRREEPGFDADVLAVKVSGLKKKYPRAADYAVGGISFEVRRGEIVGLLESFKESLVAHEPIEGLICLKPLEPQPVKICPVHHFPSPFP